MDEELHKRIVVALVATILKQMSALEGEHMHQVDKKRLDDFNKIEGDYFSEVENISFYRGKGLEIFDVVLINALLDTPRKLRTEQLYKTELSGVQEEADFFSRTLKRLGKES